MTTYAKKDYSNLVSSLTALQKDMLQKVIQQWNDNTIVIDDAQFALLPLAAQTQLTAFITRLGYS